MGRGELLVGISALPGRQVDMGDPTTVHDDDIEGELEYDIAPTTQSEKRVSGQGARQSARMFYLVRWLGSPEDECSSETVEIMEGSLELEEECHIAHTDMLQ